MLCHVLLGKKLESTDTRWHCKHCGRSCCIKCCPNSSKRPMPKFGFSSPVRSCLECSELLDAQNTAVDDMEAALESRDLNAALSLFDRRLLDYDYESASGMTCLTLAVLQQRTGVIRHLVAEGAALNCVSRARCQTPLMAGVMEVGDNLDILKLLVSLGANADLVTPDGDSALSLVRCLLAPHMLLEHRTK